MEKRVANLLSYIAHPLLIPMLGLLVISNSGTYAADLDQRFTQFIYLSVFIFTLYASGELNTLVFLLRARQEYHIFRPGRERLIPLYITLIFYLAAYFLIKKIAYKYGISAVLICLLPFNIVYSCYFLFLEDKCTHGRLGRNSGIGSQSFPAI